MSDEVAPPSFPPPLWTHIAEPDANERMVSGRILAVVQALADRANRRELAPRSDPGGSSTALRMGIAAGRALGPEASIALNAVEVAAAALAAPWLRSSSARERAVAVGLNAVGRLLPPGGGDAGRDVGTWGCIGGAIGLDFADRPPDRREAVVTVAASLALAKVDRISSGEGYAAVRAGHGAASALLAVIFVDAGLTGDPEAIGTLRERLGVASAEAGSHRADGNLAQEALVLLELALR